MSTKNISREVWTPTWVATHESFFKVGIFFNAPMAELDERTVLLRLHTTLQVRILFGVPNAVLSYYTKRNNKSFPGRIEDAPSLRYLFLKRESESYVGTVSGSGVNLKPVFYTKTSL